jgi:hypothetical protein
VERHVKKALAFAALLVAAFLAYRYAASHSPEARYRSFAEAILHRRYEEAAGMADGLSAADLEQLGSQERIGGGPAMFQTLFPSRFSIESRDTASDGAVTLHATQTVLFNPVGVESAIRPAMFATLKQVATLRKGKGGWRVSEFSNTFEKMDTLSGR